MYINEIFTDIQSLEVAEKTLQGFYSPYDTILLADSPVTLRKNLAKVINWCSRWGISIIVAKCEVIHMCCQERVEFYVNGFLILNVEIYTFLGLLIHEIFCMSCMAIDRKQKARDLFSSMKPFLIRRYVPAPFKLSLVKSVLFPIATQIWELCCMFTATVSTLKITFGNVIHLISR